MHIIIVDNGRSKHLGSPRFRNALKCIRCGACMNTCPVYRRSGGHSYGSTIPGPIGSILSPMQDMKQHSDLPFASTICGSCSDVCPVKIDISNQLYLWRQEIAHSGYAPKLINFAMKISGKVLANPKMYDFSGKMARRAIKYSPRFLLYNKFNTWGSGREMPDVPKESFKEWYKKQSKNE